MPSHTIKAKGRFYKYCQCGSGPTVLHVHGVHSNLGSMVAIAEAVLDHNYQVVLFDAPAHGEALGTTTDPSEVRDLIRGIYDRFPELHAVICHSLGGLWALSAWNGNVGAKTVISISAPATMRFLVDKGAEVAGMDGDMVQELARQLESHLGKGMWTEYSPSEVVKTIDTPGLIIHGETDDYVPLEHAENLHSCWRQSTVEVIDDAGHFDIVDSPKVRTIISTHLQGVQ
jgi:pimeloyl-ACP methyl ester carboxylesterase